MILDEDDLTEIHSRASLQGLISNSDIRTSKRVPLVVCYSLVDMGKTRYGFNQRFTEKDTRIYFERMRKICETTIDELIDQADRQWHFHAVEVKGNLRRALQQLHPKAASGIVTMYQFALYTSREGADRDKDIRSPRVFFMLGKNGMIYPLFFDPYHEINP